MELGDHLGIAGLITAFVGIGISVLFPTIRWIGYVCFAIAAIGCVCWVVLEVQQHFEVKTVAVVYRDWTPHFDRDLYPDDVPPSSYPVQGRATAQVELDAAFTNPDEIAIIAKNNRHVGMARDPKYVVILRNLDEHADRSLPAT